MAQFENVAHFGVAPSERFPNKFCNDKNAKYGQNTYLCNDKNIYVMTKIGFWRLKLLENGEKRVKIDIFDKKRSVL